MSFFGDFSDHATTLEAVDGSRQIAVKQTEPRQIMPIMMLFTLKTADGLTITCSEVYANNQSNLCDYAV